jgi:hypothetical protein
MKYLDLKINLVCDAFSLRLVYMPPLTTTTYWKKGRKKEREKERKIGSTFQLSVLSVYPIHKTMFRQVVHHISVVEALRQLHHEGALVLYRGSLPPLLVQLTIPTRLTRLGEIVPVARLLNLGSFGRNWLTPGVDVMITIFCDFRQFSAKKLAIFLKNQCYD